MSPLPCLHSRARAQGESRLAASRPQRRGIRPSDASLCHAPATNNPRPTPQGTTACPGERTSAVIADSGRRTTACWQSLVRLRPAKTPIAPRSGNPVGSGRPDAPVGLLIRRVRPHSRLTPGRCTAAFPLAQSRSRATGGDRAWSPRPEPRAARYRRDVTHGPAARGPPPDPLGQDACPDPQKSPLMSAFPCWSRRHIRTARN